MQEIARRHHVHPATICVKWAAQNGQIPIPLSLTPKNYCANLRSVVEDPLTPEEMQQILSERLQVANIPSMVVTMGGDGSVYADMHGNNGFCPAKKVDVRDTTGAGDSFCAGVVSGLTYGKTLAESVEIGTRLAASVITSSENVCPRFLPAELGIEA